MPVDLYYSPTSGQCRSVLLVARAVGVELNLKLTRISTGDTRKPEFAKINPQHCVPTLVDNGFVLWESRAILSYIVDSYAKNDSLYPKDPKRRALINQKLYFDISTLNQRFSEYYYPVRFAGLEPDPAKFQKLEEAFQLLDTFLEGQTWIAGDNLTIADIAIVTTVSTIEIFDFNISKYPNVDKWFTRAKQTIDGYDELNHAGCLEFKRKLNSAPVVKR